MGRPEIDSDMGSQIGIYCAICVHRQGTSQGFCDEDVKECGETDCPLWYFRSGISPDAFIKEKVEKAKEFIQKAWPQIKRL